ncbi:MAG: DUF6305 family protein [Candidatus Aminicenantales bacterium]
MRERRAMKLFIICGILAASFLSAQAPQPIFEQPLLITSAGQSSGDAQIALQLAKKAGLTAVLSKMAEGKDLESRKTLVLVLGASMKGMGSAGLDANKEKERIRELLAEAKRKNVPVLAMHLGGEQRRGELTDEIIGEFLPAAKMAVILKTGNADGLFTKICRGKNIPLIEVDKSLDAVEPLKNIFKRSSSY